MIYNDVTVHHKHYIIMMNVNVDFWVIEIAQCKILVWYDVRLRSISWPDLTNPNKRVPIHAHPDIPSWPNLTWPNLIQVNLHAWVRCNVMWRSPAWPNLTWPTPTKKVPIHADPESLPACPAPHRRPQHIKATEAEGKCGSGINK